ncbi:MAG: undecaprenyl-phosphate glucose phosphotransferase [Hyphomicrobiaceae bacterium]
MTSEATTEGFGLGKAREAVASRVMNLFERCFCDRIGQLRRPLLLFSLICVDLVAIALSGVGAYLLTASNGVDEFAATTSVIIVPFLVVAILSSNWSYSISALRQPAAQIGKILSAVALIALAVSGVLYLASIAVVAPVTTLTWSGFAFLALAGSRVVVARSINHFAATGRLRRRAIIVGGGEDANTLVDLLRAESTHLEILGMFDDRTHARDGTHEADVGLRRLGTFDELSTFCREAGVELLIVSVPAAAEARLLQIVKQLLQLPVDIRISAHTSKLHFNRNAYTYIGNVPMLRVLDRPLSDADRMIKNVEDRVLGLALLLMATPIMALVALAVRFESKGPILFRQKRLGFNNELIEVCKFRSMYTDMSDATAAKLVTKDDPRVTRVGRFIRKTSLDELPQLFNVLRGEMSIVGPRPHALQAKAGDDLYHDAVRSYFARHKMKPGITGWAQINGWRGETDTLEKIEQRVEHDMHYINNWSVLLDLYIIAVTPFSLIGGRNAY